MPRKRWLTHLSISDIPTINPKDRNAVADHDLVRATLVDFEEAAVLPDEIRESLVEDLVAAGRIARGGLNARKHHVSNRAMGKHVFMGDVGRAMEGAVLPVKQWQKWYDIGSDENDNGSDESVYFRLAHALGDVFGLKLPKDLKPLARQAAQIRYGAMFPVMRAAQDAEKLSIRRRQQLEVWGRPLVDVPQSCGELASAYLGFPF